MVTDISVANYDVPDNVIIIKKSFQDVQLLIHNNFDEEIRQFNGKTASIDRPYKLCEYKTAYGWLFKDLFAGYDYWGYYDIDLIWGDLKTFLPENNSNEYVKIFPCGHLSFIRNAAPYNQIYSLVNSMLDKYVNQEYHGYKLLRWQDAFSIGDSMFYDEEGGLEPLMNVLTKENGARVFNNVDFDNILPPWRFDHFQIINSPQCKNIVYTYHKGHIYRHWLENCQHKAEEISYLHISRRGMKINTGSKDCYIIYPNVFANDRNVSLLTLLVHGRPRIFLNFVYRIIRKLSKR